MREIVKIILLFGLLFNLIIQAEAQKKKRPIEVKQAKSLTAEQIAEEYLPSVVLVICDDGKETFSQGSGFFIRQGIILTNYHVVKGMKRGKVKIASEDDKANEWWIDKILYTDSKNDLALLEIKETDKTKTPVLTLSTTDKIIVGEAIYVLSNPKGLTGTISRGIVSSRIRKTKDTELLQIDAPISPGSSGGAVLSSHGEVIGIATASLKDGQNLNFAIPSSKIKSFLSEYDVATTKKEYVFFKPTIQNGWAEGEDFSNLKPVQTELKPTFEETATWLIKILEGKDSNGSDVKFLEFFGCTMKYEKQSFWRNAQASGTNKIGYTSGRIYNVNLKSLTETYLNANKTIVFLQLSKKPEIQDYSYFQNEERSYGEEKQDENDYVFFWSANEEIGKRIVRAFERIKELCVEDTKQV